MVEELKICLIFLSFERLFFQKIRHRHQNQNCWCTLFHYTIWLLFLNCEYLEKATKNIIQNLKYINFKIDENTEETKEKKSILNHRIIIVMLYQYHYYYSYQKLLKIFENFEMQIVIVQ
jgi:hypothetical protein